MMTANGLAKLLEEMRDARYAMVNYGGASRRDAIDMQIRLEDAIADVIAAATVTVRQLGLRRGDIMERAESRIKAFEGSEIFE